VRAGAHALSLLSVPLNAHVLQALADEPRSLIELRRVAGSPQTTMRGHLRTLTELHVVERHRRTDFPGSVDYVLGRPGRDLLEVAAVLQTWLKGSPGNPLSIGSIAAKGAIKSLVDGWSSTVIRAIAARPLALTELNRLIVGLNYPSLERRLGAMRLAGQIESSPGRTRGTPYVPTAWLRHAIAPLTAAADWERRHLPSNLAAPIGRLDIEAGFLLAIPLLSLETNMSGVCRLAVELPKNGDQDVAGALIGVDEGRIASCVSRLGGDATAWASGFAPAWLQAVIHRERDSLEIGGDCSLAAAVVDGLQKTLFEPQPALRS
jgi:DNA-binding HxlR family transcriptional regulator